MKEILNKLLLARDKFMPEMHLRHPRFMYIAHEPFIRNKKKIERFGETRNLRYIYQNELDKGCFQYDMPCGDFKDLCRTKSFNKALCDKAFNIAKYPKHDVSQIFLVKFFCWFY